MHPQAVAVLADAHLEELRRSAADSRRGRSTSCATVVRRYWRRDHEVDQQPFHRPYR